MVHDFATAQRVRVGCGVAAGIADEVGGWGRRALLVCGGDVARVRGVQASLEGRGCTVSSLSVVGEPSLRWLRAQLSRWRGAGVEWVVGVGGGSVIDAGKALAALLPQAGDPLDYLEVVGGGQALVSPSLPYAAVPTTAGTGAEVTRNAVLTVDEAQVKASLRSPWMLPRLALIDPLLSASMPPGLTAATGLDAVAQVLEPFVGRSPSPLVDGLCRQGLAMAGGALPRAWVDGADLAAREAMAWVALMGGMALANGKLGAVHGFAAPLGAMLGAGHGALCAALLPGVVQVNVGALQARGDGAAVLGRYAEAARLLSGGAVQEAEAFGPWLAAWTRSMGVQPLAALGLRREQWPEVVAKACQANSMRGNPVALRPEEMQEILRIS